VPENDKHKPTVLAADAVNQFDLVGRLGRNALFSPCDEHLLHRLAACASLNVALRGTRVAQAGTRFPYVGMVCSGALAVTIDAAGPIRGVRRMQLYEARANALFGEVALLAQRPPPGDVLVLSKSAVYALFPADAVEDAMAADPKLLRRLAADVAGGTYLIAQRLLRSHNWPLTARVASVLLRFAANEGGLQAAHPEISEMTQRDIAAAAACVKESAARAIAYLESVGALRRERGHIRELDRGVLEQFAEGLR